MSSKSDQEKQEEILKKVGEAKEKWDAEDHDKDEDETDALLTKAIELALEQGKGWNPGEKEAYTKMILDDDFIPPLFATDMEDLEKSGLQDAFSSLLNDEPATRMMLESKKKGNESFASGKRNLVHNVQFYRDAVNHYYEAFAWAEKVVPLEQGPPVPEENDDPLYTEQELDEMKATLLANAAMAHIQLRNWGHVRDDVSKALKFNDKNLKAWYRLAKAYQMLQNWEQAGDAIDSGLAVQSDNTELLKLQATLASHVRKARLARQKRERARAERISRIKEVWKWCKQNNIQLGRVPLVSTVMDDEEEDSSSRWHHHHPHTGRLPVRNVSGEWSWPCMFLYPSHGQSDYVENFRESEMLALRMADMFPELEDNSNRETTMPWDYNNEFYCSNLAVYFEVHCTEEFEGEVVHPEFVDRIREQGEAVRFYESSRALKGDEGVDMGNLARAVERKRLHKQRVAWKKRYKSLWAKPDPSPVVRVHPALTLRDILVDSRFVVPNFLVTLYLFPMSHPAHTEYLDEHKCLAVLQPKNVD